MSASSASPSAFGKTSTAAEVVKGIDLKGVVALVTGGTSGIGVETVRALYSAGATVIVMARDKAKGEKVLSSLRSSSSSGSLSLLECDLSSIASVKQAAQSLLDQKPTMPLHLLINNAGVAPATYQRSVDGFELNYAVNTIAPLLLSVLLAPLLAHANSSSSPARRRARVINLASAAHRYSNSVDYSIVKLPQAEKDGEQTEAEKKAFTSLWVPYGSSKLATILATREFARLYAAHGIDAYSCHPGVIRTPINDAHAEQFIAAGLYNKNVEQGAATTVWVATAPQLASQSGLYYEDCALSDRAPASVDDTAAVTDAFNRALEYGGLSPSSLPLSPSFPTYAAKTPAIKVMEDSSHSVAGKVVIVTGASSGIGVETARAFAHGGAHVFVGARNVEAANAVIADIKAATKNDKVELLQLDLTSFASVRAAAATFKARKLPLHFLILNAGIMACPYKLVENHESQFAVNHLAHFLLTHELLDVLVAAAPARVVSLTSVGHKRGDIKFDDINFTTTTNQYEKWAAYGQSKTANIYFSWYLNHVYAAKGVNALAVHPGGIMTGLQKDLSLEEQTAMGWHSEAAKAIFKSVSEGASSTLFAAVSDELYLRGGIYVEDCHPARKEAKLPYEGVAPHIQAYTHDGTGKRLWEYSVKAVNATADSKL